MFIVETWLYAGGGRYPQGGIGLGIRAVWRWNSSQVLLVEPDVIGL
jgi:hypothetical protein